MQDFDDTRNLLCEELLAALWLLDDGGSDSENDGPGGGALPDHTTADTKSMIAQHLQLRLQELQNKEERAVLVPEVYRPIVLLTLAVRSDSRGDLRPSRTLFMFDRFEPLITAIMWDLIPDDRKKQIVKSHRLAYQNLPDDRKGEIAEKIRSIHLRCPKMCGRLARWLWSSAGRRQTPKANWLFRSKRARLSVDSGGSCQQCRNTCVSVLFSRRTHRFWNLLPKQYLVVLNYGMRAR